MNKINKSFIIIFLLSSATIWGQHKEFGLGFVAGSPTGISAKYWVNSINAFDFGLGYSFAQNNSNFNFHADYLWHNSEFFHSSEKLLFHYGVGLRIKTVVDGRDSFGARAVAGVSWFPSHTPFEFFVEVAPVFKLIPETALDIDGGLGARFYF
ncbi:MAG: hypothetical protein Q8N83_06850 [Ignavibacteria bacterium]|nr:hypothetical protein [Ignavibacteria bacterium]